MCTIISLLKRLFAKIGWHKSSAASPQCGLPAQAQNVPDYERSTRNERPWTSLFDGGFR
ncbi:MAG: hypothetical protein HY667_02920 [Chloroflexi bacterium]|nr:hypothetical protein [Chloroflexota bacterium]